MEYIKKTDSIGEILTEDLIDAESLDEFVLGDYNKAFYLGWTITSALEYKILKRAFVCDIQDTLAKNVDTDLGIEIPKLLSEYSECFPNSKVSAIDASNWVLTVLEKDGKTKDELIISAFSLGFSLSEAAK